MQLIRTCRYKLLRKIHSLVSDTLYTEILENQGSPNRSQTHDLLIIGSTEALVTTELYIYM